jgi:hypothetical protein
MQRMPDPARTGPQRTADVRTHLRAVGADAWVATASTAGVAHLVPLSFAWDGRSIVLAAEPTSLTVRNIQASGRARLALGATRDVVLVDAELDSAVDIEGTPRALVDGYVQQAGWDPRREADPYFLLVLRPVRIQAWRESNELQGRMVMRDGEWIY